MSAVQGVFVLWSGISQVLVGGIYLESEFPPKPSFVPSGGTQETLDRDAREMSVLQSSWGHKVMAQGKPSSGVLDLWAASVSSEP